MILVEKGHVSQSLLWIDARFMYCTYIVVTYDMYLGRYKACMYCTRYTYSVCSQMHHIIMHCGG